MIAGNLKKESEAYFWESERERGLMCLIIFAYDCHPHYRLILAANRDEYFHRPTERAHFWQSNPRVLAGRDLEMLGTWMGITRSGRFAALTNFRDPLAQITNAKSRGTLVSGFLCMNEYPIRYLQEVELSRDLYNPFNLLVGDLSNLMYYCHQTSEVKVLKPKIYGLSNHRLDTPWPKVQKSKQALANYIDNKTLIESQALFEILADDKMAQDRELPDTGISYEFEKLLSSIFIQGTDYGTRSSTVLFIDRDDRVTFKERSFNQSPKNFVEVCYEFDLQK